jgi:hypothetical protein
MPSSLKPARDSQRIRVYRANSGVLGTPLPHMDDVHDFAQEVVDSKIWRDLFPNAEVWKVPKLKPGKGARTAHVLWHFDGRIEIAFPRAYRYATYVLHELAHYGLGLDNSIAAHGPEFVGMWMALVREFCSTRTINALEKNLVREKVKMYIPLSRSNTISVVVIRDESDVPVPRVVNGDHQMKLFA